MPNEFSALETVTNKVAQTANKVSNWAKGLSWDSPTQSNSPFKGIKSFDALNEKYRELLSTDYKDKRSQLNVLYLQSMLLVSNNFIKGLNNLKDYYGRLENKTTDAVPENVSAKEFLNQYVDSTSGKFVQSGVKQPVEPKTAENPTKNKIEEALSKELDELLKTIGFYKESLFDPLYSTDKVKFIDNTISKMVSFVENTKVKLAKYQQEVATGKQLPKKSKEQPKTGDSYLTNGGSKKLKIKIKSR